MAHQSVALALNGDPLGSIDTGNGAEHVYTFGSLAVGSYTLTATATGGGSTNSASFSVVTPAGAPTSLSASDIQADRATLSWTASSGSEPITYHWAVLPADGGGAAASGSTSSTSVTASGLSPGTLYLFTVSASNTGGTSATVTSPTFATLKLVQAPVTGSLASSSIASGLTTTVSGSGGSGTGAFEFRQSAGTTAVEFSGSGTSRTITGAAVGSATIEVRRLGDSSYNDSPWVEVGTLVVTPGAPNQILVVTQPSRMINGDALSSFVLEIFDAQGNRVDDATLSVAASLEPSTPVGVTLVPEGAVVSVSEGIATFSGLVVQGTRDDTVHLRFALIEHPSVHATVEYLLVELAALDVEVTARVSADAPFGALPSTHPGEGVEFKATFNNAGVESATDVVIQVALPAGLRLLNGDTSVRVVCPHVGQSAPTPVVSQGRIATAGNALVVDVPLDAVCPPGLVPPAGTGWVTFTVQAW